MTARSLLEIRNEIITNKGKRNKQYQKYIYASSNKTFFLNRRHRSNIKLLLPLADDYAEIIHSFVSLFYFSNKMKKNNSSEYKTTAVSIIQRRKILWKIVVWSQKCYRFNSHLQVGQLPICYHKRYDTSIFSTSTSISRHLFSLTCVVWQDISLYPDLQCAL